MAYTQRQQAIQVINAYAEMMSAGKGGTVTNANSGATQVPADDLFAMMGVQVKS